MKRTVFVESDGRVRVIIPNETLKKEAESEEQFIKRIADTAVERDETLKPCKRYTIDDIDMPVRDENRDKWRMKDVYGKPTIYVDETIKLKREFLREKENDIDIELSKQNPDAIKVLKLQRELEKLKKMGVK